MFNLPALDKGSFLTYLGKQKKEKKPTNIETKTIMRVILLGQLPKWLFNQWLYHIITIIIKNEPPFTHTPWYGTAVKKEEATLLSHTESKE